MDINSIRVGVIAFVAAAVGLHVWLWGAAWRRAREGRELLDWSPRRPAPWGLVDVATCFLLLVIGEAGAMQAAGLDPSTGMDQATLGEQTLGLSVISISRTVAAILSLMLVATRLQASLDDLGGLTRQIGRDVRLGATVFFMIAPPLYALQALLASVWRPTTNPVVVMLEENPDLRLFAASVATAVIAAPLSEEILFRMFFQGWLQKAALWRGGAGVLFWGAPAPQSEARGPSVSDAFARPPAWPILLSALFFALMHLHEEISPDPIPLFFFACALGFVYQRTHRLLPCIVTHMLLNAFSMSQLALGIWAPELFGP